MRAGCHFFKIRCNKSNFSKKDGVNVLPRCALILTEKGLKPKLRDTRLSLDSSLMYVQLGEGLREIIRSSSLCLSAHLHSGMNFVCETKVVKIEIRIVGSKKSRIGVGSHTSIGSTVGSVGSSDPTILLQSHSGPTKHAIWADLYYGLMRSTRAY